MVARFSTNSHLKAEAPLKGKIVSLGLLLLSLSMIACAPTRSGSNRNSQLIRAAEKGQTKEVYRLIEAGADVNGRDAEGWTPYMAASSMGQLDAMRVLVAFGAKTVPPDLNDEDASHRFLADR
jgi:ankyrin repeat protein